MLENTEEQKYKKNIAQEEISRAEYKINNGNRSINQTRKELGLKPLPYNNCDELITIK